MSWKNFSKYQRDSVSSAARGSAYIGVVKAAQDIQLSSYPWRRFLWDFASRDWRIARSFTHIKMATLLQYSRLFSRTLAGSLASDSAKEGFVTPIAALPRNSQHNQQHAWSVASPAVLSTGTNHGT